MYLNTDFVSLESMVRDYIIEQSSRSWNSTQTLRAINDEYSRLVRAALNADQDFFMTTKTWSSISSNTLTLPRNIYRIRSAEIHKNSRWKKIFPVFPHKLHELNRPDSSTTHANAYRLTNFSLILEPGYTEVDQVRIRYSRVPAPLIYGQASAGAATTITFDTNASILADAYNDDEIMLTSGTGEGQVNTVSDYSTAREATVDTWTTNPDATSYYSTLLAPPVANFPELVAKGAAIRMLYKKRDSEQIQ